MEFLVIIINQSLILHSFIFLVESSKNDQFQLLASVGEPASGIFYLRDHYYGVNSTSGKIFKIDNGSPVAIYENLSSIVCVLPFADRIAIVQSSKLSIISDLSNLQTFPDVIMASPSDNEIICAISNSHGNIILLGRKKDILIVTRTNDRYNIETIINTSSQVTAMAITSNLNYIAYAEEQQKRIRVLTRESSCTLKWKLIEKLKWCHHTSRICGLVWLEETEVKKSLDVPVLVSAGSIDRELAVWSVEGSPLKPCARKSGAHFGMITGLTTFNHSSAMNNVFVTAGQDGLVKYWRLDA